MNPTLTTERCLLQPMARDDAGALRELWSSPGVRRFLWDDEIVSMTQTEAAIAQSLRMFERYACGLWGVRLTSSPDLIGFAGLWPFREPPALELLYGIGESHWGRGYATEVARAVMTHCYESLEMRLVQASTDAANRASIRVLEKLGFKEVRREVVHGLDTVFYERLRSPEPT